MKIHISVRITDDKYNTVESREIMVDTADGHVTRVGELTDELLLNAVEAYQAKLAIPSTEPIA